MHEEIKGRLNSGNACYHSVHSLLSSRLLSRNLKVKIHKIIIPPVVLYGYENWSLTLKEEYWLRVFENWLLRKIFRPRLNEVTGEWRKLHNGELHNLYWSPDNIRHMKSRRLWWAGHVASMGEGKILYRVLVGKSEGKRPLGRRRSRRENGFRSDLGQIRWGCGMDSSGSGQGPVEGSHESNDEPSGSPAHACYTSR
jgi:hypothetical protein